MTRSAVNPVSRFAAALAAVLCLYAVPAAAQSKAVLKKLNARYERVSRFDDGRAFVLKNGKYGYVDTLGRLVVPLVYDKALRFHNGYAAAALGQGKERRWGLIDRSGREVVPSVWEKLGNVHDGVAVGRTVDADGTCRFSLVDTTGTVRPLEWALCRDFSNGLAVVGDGTCTCNLEKVSFTGKYGYIAPDGETVIPARFDGADKFGDDGFAPAGMQGKYYVKWGFIDREGNTVVPFVWYSVSPFERDRALVSKIAAGGRRVYGYIDRSGKEVIPCRYDEATGFRFRNTWVGTEQDGEMRYMLIDSVGNSLLRFTVLSLQDGGNYGQAACAVRGDDGKLRYGILSNEGRTILPFEYDDITIYSEWDPADRRWREAGIAVKDGKNLSFDLSKRGE